MTNTKSLKDGSVDLKQPILSRCPHCDKPNPVIGAHQIGESSDAILVAFVPECCKRIISCMLVAKAAQVPVVN